MASPGGDLIRGSLLDGNHRAVWCGGVDRGGWGCDIERYAVSPGGKRQPVGTDLVGEVAIGGNAIGAYEHRTHIAQAKATRDHPIGNERDRHPAPVELPGGEATALEKRSGFGHHYVRSAPGAVLHVHRSQRGT